MVMAKKVTCRTRRKNYENLKTEESRVNSINSIDWKLTKSIQVEQTRVTKSARVEGSGANDENRKRASLQPQKSKKKRFTNDR